MRKITLAVLFLSLAGALPVAAAPPANADPELAPWFQSLKQPDNGIGCCSVADCRGVAYREAGDSVEVFVDEKTYGFGAPNAWVAVPPGKILLRQENRTGNAIACWHPGIGIMCFVRPPDV